MVLNKWGHLKRETFLDFELKVTDRKVVLAQYWFDKISDLRRNYFRNKTFPAL